MMIVFDGLPPDSGIRVALSRLFFFQAEDGIRDLTVTGVQTCALPIFGGLRMRVPQLRYKPTKRRWAGWFAGARRPRRLQRRHRVRRFTTDSVGSTGIRC